VAITSAYLDDQQGNILTLIPAQNITVTAINIGFPEVRAVTERRSDTDGERDTTALYGARAVSINAGLYNTPGVLADRWRAFLAPRKRCYLYVTDTEWAGGRRILLRADQWTDPIVEGADDVYRAIQAQWRAPAGVWEDVSLTTVTLAALVSAGTGLSFPRAFPVAWPTTAAASTLLISNTGAVAMHFVARMYGPCDGPALFNDSTGQVIAFLPAPAGLALAAGQYVEVDTLERTAYLMSDTSQSRLNFIDFTASQWWQLQPGTNVVRFGPSGSASLGSAVSLDYRQTYL
jgi:Siphovirus-type tail component, C-terminal domain